MIKLKHIINDVVVNEFDMVEGSFTIGRSQSNSLQLDDAMVSGEHAVLRFVPNEYMPEMLDVTIRDLGSTNGTFVNNTSVQELKIKHGDTIRIGNNEFRLFDEGSAVGTQTEFYVPEE
ncbi:MAG: FHA domain-containing protein [Gammaproteobacteria bacterium]|nr:FHA domain-containing protein [Gammaproteobacteria bacterium]MCW8909403.1 FHA domain-containing protein [Gammaproteobacteria bacterium]MCW9004229.1 FHA domain-containing protein [Gammaproteobacteria bacterium]MCW9055198.1 FHA domain-containing protein [Gammaproteobacteria bacterium]